MSITDSKISRGGKTSWKCVTLLLGTTATSQTGKKTDGCIPGFPFQVMRVEVNALTVTAAITVDVQITTLSVLTGAITPVAATPTAGTLSTTLANLRGAATEAINLLYTSDSAGAATNGVVRVWIRPVPLHAEVYYV